MALMCGASLGEFLDPGRYVDGRVWQAQLHLAFESWLGLGGYVIPQGLDIVLPWSCSKHAGLLPGWSNGSLRAQFARWKLDIALSVSVRAAIVLPRLWI